MHRLGIRGRKNFDPAEFEWPQPPPGLLESEKLERIQGQAHNWAPDPRGSHASKSRIVFRAEKPEANRSIRFSGGVFSAANPRDHHAFYKARACRLPGPPCFDPPYLITQGQRLGSPAPRSAPFRQPGRVRCGKARPPT